MKTKLFFLACSVMILGSCNDSQESSSPEEKLKQNEPISLMAAPSASAQIKKGYYRGEEVTYVRDNGVNILDGDMILADAEVSNTPQVSTEGTGTRFRRWPNKAVWYKFYNGNSSQRAQFVQAANSWRNATGLAMNNITASPLNQIGYHIAVYFNQTGNNSQVGWQGTGVGATPGQRLNIQSNNVGVMIHELGHAIGMEHEQNRSDRDNFIRVNFSNLRPLGAANFVKLRAADEFKTGGFDFRSVMLYSSRITDPAFVFNTNINSATRLDGSAWGDVTGTATTPSAGDARWVRAAYGL